MRPPIAITMGDPAGIGPEVILKALLRPSARRIGRVVVIGDAGLFRKTADQLGLPARWRTVYSVEEATGSPGEIALLDLKNVDLSRWRWGRPEQTGGRAAVEAVRVAAQLAMDRRVCAIVTAPISKAALRAARYPLPGHTELLARLAGVADVGMLMIAPVPRTFHPCLKPRTSKPPTHLRILLATTHLAIHRLPKALTRARVGTAIRLAREAAVRYFDLRRPRLGVAALNPHAGEGGLFGREEDRVIRPAVQQARRQGLQVAGPLPADSLIRRATEGEFDIVVAMYHDQALIPIKLLGFGRAVNMTVGLPFIRTSVDHGTAFDIAGKGAADPGSLIEAIALAARLAGPSGR